VFLNLIVNAEHAIKKTGKSGRLTIKAKKLDGHIRINFSDNGQGIDKDVLPKLFQPFFTTKAPGEGTGLGLSLSRSIIMEHGGTIEVESELGHGASFIIELPITAEPEAVALEESIQESHTAAPVRADILVVDDEIYIQRLLRETLSGEGRFIHVVGGASEALGNLKNQHYDLILMDLRMPGSSGMALYKEIISRRPEMDGRIVIITGDALGDDVIPFIAEHRLEVLVKPFDQAALQQMVDRMLEAGRTGRRV
jgi:CheY-like chemotaxis protein